MNLYEREMRMMFADNDIIKNPLIVGRTLTGTLDEDLRIKLKFIASEVQGKYDTIRAVIINRTGGEVDSQNFLFADIIGMQQRNNGLPPIVPHITPEKCLICGKTITPKALGTFRLHWNKNLK